MLTLWWAPCMLAPHGHGQAASPLLYVLVTLICSSAGFWRLPSSSWQPRGPNHPLYDSYNPMGPWASSQRPWTDAWRKNQRQPLSLEESSIGEGSGSHGGGGQRSLLLERDRGLMVLRMFSRNATGYGDMQEVKVRPQGPRIPPSLNTTPSFLDYPNSTFPVVSPSPPL
jgi:hypothetical protein